MANCSGKESEVDNEKAYNHVLIYKPGYDKDGKEVAIKVPGVEIDSVNKTLTYVRNGFKVTTNYNGQITYHAEHMIKASASNTEVRVGNYIRSVDSRGFTTKVTPVITQNANGNWIIPDGVNRTDISTGREYYQSANGVSAAQRSREIAAGPGETRTAQEIFRSLVGATSEADIIKQGFKLG